MNAGAAETGASPGAGSSLNWKLFFGLSRTPHGVLDVATPAMGALLLLGHFPSAWVVVVGLITAFAGYTAVYALNDLVDYRIDQERLSSRSPSGRHFHVDEILVRHPVAQGLLPFRSGLLWFGFWTVVGLAGAYWLNPVCCVLLAVTAILEILYCKLLRVTHLKIIPSAIVKATGGLAGVYAVNPDPSPAFVVIIFLWLAAWEVGGQNIANDIVDMEDDARVGAKTTATVTGMQESVFRLLVAVAMAAFGSVTVYWVAGSGVGILYPIGAVILAWFLLLDPARKLYYSPGTDTAAALFNRASYVPVSFFGLTVVSILLPW